MTTTVVASALPAIPWEDRPQGSDQVVWRSAHNPVIPRNLLPDSNGIFNSAVVIAGENRTLVEKLQSWLLAATEAKSLQQWLRYVMVEVANLVYGERLL